MFINCTAHTLTTSQIEKAKEFSDNIADLKDLNPELHTGLVNCPADEERIGELADTLISFLKKKELESGGNLYLHLPIGSPYFMAVFSLRFPRDSSIRFVFSHSDRVSVDEKQEDGTVVKRAVFQFVRYLVLDRT